MQRSANDTKRGLVVRSWMAGLLALTVLCPRGLAAEARTTAHFRKDIQPILVEYCYDCHGDGMDKGKVAFDGFKSDEELLAKNDLWWAVLKNLRAGLMPPEKKPRPSADQLRLLESWIKGSVFGIDPMDPDPGRVTIHRLNRVEYRNTIRDLMGIDFKADEEFPPDDTGYGFDNIGDVLTVSPMLLEKYMQAAETIAASAVPRVARVVQEKTVPGSAFQKTDAEGGNARSAERYTFYEEAKLAHVFQAEQNGSYRLVLELEVAGEFDFDPGRCRVLFKVDDRELLAQEFGWQNNKRFRFEFNEEWPAGEHRMVLELHPLTPVEQKKNSLNLRISAVRVRGPLQQQHWVRPKNFELFFSQDPPEERAERRRYAREVLNRFAKKAFRRPADDRTVDRLVTIAEDFYSESDDLFEEGVARAMVAVLSSPRFLFRVEEISPGSSAKLHPFVDEYALASRLSYFLWSTMPDEELFRLVERGELRKNLSSQVKRMLADPRSEELTENFTGQWLQVRDIEGININARVVLARDSGEEAQLKREEEEFRARLANRQAQTNLATPTNLVAQATAASQTNRPAPVNPERPINRQRFRRPAFELDTPLRQAMRQETEMCFAHVVREDRSVLELIDSDYTFLNERLAKLYGIQDVEGNEMRRVTLPEDHPRGGVLTHGAVLAVTSNPTRTSPVKRGLFVLENIMGTPTPPAPPEGVPDLEESEKEFQDHEPTLREVLQLHRSKPLCSSCHNRMDPLGLALENFNALGMWREKERGQSIDSAGKLVTGEAFTGIHDLKRILTHERRSDFYRCLTEKLLTYALGRGLEYYDAHTVDQIVERLEKDQGRFSALLMGVIESAPFQKRRNSSAIRSASALSADQHAGALTANE